MAHLYEIPTQELTNRRFTEYKKDFIDRYFPVDKTVRVLDIGCGYGLFLKTARDLGYTNIEGIERENDIADFARKTYNLPHITTGDLFATLEKIPDGQYYIITAFNIIEHIKKERVVETLELVARKLRPSGRFIMEVPNADSPLGIHTRYSDITHEFAFSPSLARELLAAAGFDSIEVRPKFVNANPVMRLAQKLLAKIIGVNNEFFFSGNLIATGIKRNG